MSTVRFSVAPGIAAPAGAVLNPLTNIRHVVAPAGRAKAMFDRLTGNYTALQKSRIAQTLFDLIDAGILDDQELFCLRGLTLQDMVGINWASTTTLPTLVGGTFVSGKGIQLDGVADYINANFKVGRYALGDASIWAWTSAYNAVGMTSPPNSPRLFGRIASLTTGANAELTLNSASTSLRLNQTGNIAMTNPASFPPQLGFLAGVDDGGTSKGYYNGQPAGSGTPATPAVHTASAGLAFGRSGSIFYPWTYQAFGYGKKMSDAKIKALYDILTPHFAAI